MFDQFLHIIFCVWSKPSRFKDEVFLCMAVWTEQFKVFWISVHSVMINVMNDKDFWNFIVSTPLTFVRSSCKYFFLLDLRSCGRIVQFFVGSKLSSTFCRTKISLSVFDLVRKTKKLSSTDHATFFNFRYSFYGRMPFCKVFGSVYLRTFSATKFCFYGINDFKCFATRFANYGSKWNFRSNVMPSNEFSGRDGGDQFFAASTRADSFWTRITSVVWEIVKSYCSLFRQLYPAPAPANFSWDDRQAFPTWKDLIENVFGHGLVRLSFPSLRESIVSSWSDYMLPLGLCLGEKK
jgi:hypothetical protein